MWEHRLKWTTHDSVDDNRSITTEHAGERQRMNLFRCTHSLSYLGEFSKVSPYFCQYLGKPILTIAHRFSNCRLYVVHCFQTVRGTSFMKTSLGTLYVVQRLLNSLVS